MLNVTIPETEFFDETTQEFVKIPAKDLELEHSLISLSKWESYWCKPFLGKDEKTNEETLDYIRHMTVTRNVDPFVYSAIPSGVIDNVNNYISAPMTATTFSAEAGRPSSEIITSEIIYYWMIALNIPFECQKWHLNRLLTLIRVCNIKNSPPKKMSRRDLHARNRALNDARRQSLNTTG